MIHIFIGYDPRESVAYHVCCNSLLRHSSQPLALTPLALQNLGQYTENHHDGSNQFIYSRFLVPHLMQYQGWALFIDGDMIVREDINHLWSLKDESKAVLCVQHNYKTRSATKYLGAKNENYPRKNWSSVVLWNCAHPKNQILTPAFIQDASGAQLHRFTWLDDSDIGNLPIEWNWLPDEFGAHAQAKLLHWTLGTPCFKDYAQSPMAQEWHAERLLTEHADNYKHPMAA